MSKNIEKGLACRQAGFAPILIIILIAIIGASAVLIIKNIPFNQSHPISNTNTQSSNSAEINPSPTPTISKTISIKTTPTASVTVKPTITNTPTPTSSPNNNNSNNPTSTPTPTPTPTPTSTPTPTPTAIPFTSFSNNGITVKVSCNGSAMNVSVSSKLTASSSDGGIWGAIVDNNTLNKMIYTFVGASGYYTDYNISANFPPTGAIRGSNMTLVADERSYSVRAYYGPFTEGTPSLGTHFARVDFSKTCP